MTLRFFGGLAALAVVIVLLSFLSKAFGEKRQDRWDIAQTEVEQSILRTL
jgi:hypothetical protein